MAMEEGGEEESAASSAIAALLAETVAAVAAAEIGDGDVDMEPAGQQLVQQQQEQEQQAAGAGPQTEAPPHVLPPTQPQLPVLPPTEVQCPDSPQGAAVETAELVAGQSQLPTAQQPQQAVASVQPPTVLAPPVQLPPWLLAVKVTARNGQFDWLGPDDAGSIFTIK